MAETPVLNNLTNLQNETTAVSLINANNSAITAAFSDVLSRSTSAGSGTNTMTSTLDMNSQRIVNLAAPTANSDAARLQDVINNTNITTIQTGVLQGGAVNALPVFATATAITSNTGTGTAGQLLVGQTGAAPAWKTASGDVTVTSAGATAIGANKVTVAMQSTMAANTFMGNATNATATPTANTITQVIDTVVPGSVAAQGDVLYRNASAWINLTAGSAGQYLRTSGTNSNPTWSSNAGGTGFATVAIQKFTASGTYTPTANMKYCTIECVGGGGGGGGASQTGTATSWGCAGGGGAGAYSRKTASAATVGASQAVTIGGGGTGGTSAGGTGSSGAQTSVGTLCVAFGGSGGVGLVSGIGPGPTGGQGGSGGSGTGDITAGGAIGGPGFIDLAWSGGVFPNAWGGFGGSTIFGAGAKSQNNYSQVGIAAENNTGGGGGAGTINNSGVSTTGGQGGSGVILITEFI